MRVTLLSALVLAFTGSRPLPPTAQVPRDDLDQLPAARVVAQGGELVVELSPVDVPPRDSNGPGMVLTPLLKAEIPVSGSLYRFRAEVVDGRGEPLPHDLLHHVNLTDPSRRELFLSTSLHIIAASKETPELSVPRLLFGMPVSKGDRYLAGAMLANESDRPVHGARVRLVYRYVAAWLPWPLFEAYPWVMDVMFPLGRLRDGRKAFDLPPGRSARSWESRPAVPGTLLGLGGHLHDYGVSLTLEDVTAGDTLWHGEPVRDSTGVVLLMPVHRFYRWNRLGVHIEPSHAYRVTAEYDNPTGAAIEEGGMAAVGGMFVPDRGVEWPAVNPVDSIYLEDLRFTFENARNAAAHVMHGHGAGAGGRR